MAEKKGHTRRPSLYGVEGSDVSQLYEQLGSAEKLRETLSSLSESFDSQINTRSSGNFSLPSSRTMSFTDRNSISSVDNRTMQGSTTSEEDLSESEGLWLFSEGGKKMIRGATLPKLVEFLTTTRDPDFNTYIKDILCTYQAFIFPSDLMNALQSRYQNPTGGNDPADFLHVQYVQQAIASTILLWVTDHIKDFFDNPKLIGQLSEFISAVQVPGYAPYDTLLTAMERLTKCLNTPEPEAPLRRIDDALNVVFEKLTPRVVAEALTDMEWTILDHIRPREFLFQSWLKQDAERLSPNLFAAIHWDKQTTAWVTTEIKGTMDPEKRAQVLEKFVHIAYELFELNNFNGLVEILSGIRTPSGKLIAEITTPGVKEKLNKLEYLMDPSGVFSRYRKYLKSASCPRIPYLDVFLTQMAYLDYTNPDVLEDNILNIHKYHKMGQKNTKVYHTSEEIGSSAQHDHGASYGIILYAGNTDIIQGILFSQWVQIHKKHNHHGPTRQIVCKGRVTGTTSRRGQGGYIHSIRRRH